MTLHLQVKLTINQRNNFLPYSCVHELFLKGRFFSEPLEDLSRLNQHWPKIYAKIGIPPFRGKFL